jgi:hypothetical protein
MNLRRIRISAGGLEIMATMAESPVADAIWRTLPLSGSAQTWGDEIYFATTIQPIDDPDSAHETVELGSIGYWPPGGALCLFFGPTPMSRGDEIRPASAVNVVGAMDGNPKALKAVAAGTLVTIEPA